MTSNHTILIINPWQGIIGPNIGFGQLVEESLRRKIEVHVLCRERDDMAARAESMGARLHIDKALSLTPRDLNAKSIPLHLQIAANQIRCTYRVATQVRPDAICINAENILFAPLASRIAGVPCAVYVRGARFIELKHLGRIYFSLQRAAHPTYLAVSQHVADGLAQLGVPVEKIEVVPNGVNLNRFHPIPADHTLKNELGVPSNHRLIGTICHLTPRKGVHHLIEIMALLKNRIENLTCLVVGGVHDASYATTLQQRIDQCGLHDRMKLLGQRTDTSRILSCLELLVHPSETESFGRTIAEAMAMAKPVVGFDVGAVPELIQHGECGFVAKPFDYPQAAQFIERILKDATMLESMGQHALRRATEHYNLSTNIARAVDILERLARSGTQKSHLP